MADNLRAAKGILTGAVLSIAFWAAVAGTVAVVNSCAENNSVPKMSKGE